MAYILTALLVVLPLAAAGYAHSRLVKDAKRKKDLWTSRLLLLVVGIAFGWAMATFYASATGFERVFVFLGAFGLAHVPAAAILFIKAQRGKSG